MRHPLLACLCLCTALTTQSSHILAADTSDPLPLIDVEKDSRASYRTARADALGIAETLLGGPKSTDKFWAPEESVPSTAKVLLGSLGVLEKGIDETTTATDKAVFFLTRFAHFWRGASPEDLALLLTNIQELCLVPKGSKGVGLSDPFITNAFVDIASQLHESGKLPSDHILSVKQLGRLGHVGARYLYARIISQNGEMNLYQKVHALAFFRAVPDPVGITPSAWLTGLLDLDTDENLLNWDEARATLFDVLSQNFDVFDAPTVRRLWNLMLENPPPTPELRDPMLKVVTTALVRAIPDAKTPETMSWQMLLEEIKDEKHKGSLDFLKNPLLSKRVKLHQFAELTKSVAAYQAWASDYALHGEDEPSLKRAQLFEEMASASSEGGDHEKAQGVGNVLANAMTLNQNNTSMALISQLRGEIKAAFDIAEGDAKLTLQKRLWVLDQLLVMNGKAQTTEVYDEAAETLNTPDNGEAFAYIQDQLLEKRRAAPFLPAALGFDMMTPQERFTNLLHLLDSPLGVEFFIKAHYGAAAFNNEWFDDPLALWGQHFGLAEVALADIHTKTGRTNSIEFLTDTQILSALLESAIQHNSRTAQMYALKYIENTRDVFQKQRKAALAEQYSEYINILDNAFRIIRVTQSM